jgi:ATP-dependent helicase/nuclease subunit A
MTTVTRLVYFARCPMVYYHNLVLQVEEHPTGRQKAVSADPRPMSALDRGSKVHELLEVARFDADPVAEAARLAGQLHGVADADRMKITSMLQRVLADPLLDRARRARRIEREYPFFLDLNGTTVQGVIDLVFEDEDGRGVVVDYKSNDLSAPDRINVLTEHYRPQIELYALAARRAGLIEPAEATLYFLNTAEARTRQVDESRLGAVEQEAVEMVSKIARGAWDTEPAEKCRRCGYRKRGFCETGKKFVE